MGCSIGRSPCDRAAPETMEIVDQAECNRRRLCASAGERIGEIQGQGSAGHLSSRPRRIADPCPCMPTSNSGANACARYSLVPVWYPSSPPAPTDRLKLRCGKWRLSANAAPRPAQAGPLSTIEKSLLGSVLPSHSFGASSVRGPCPKRYGPLSLLGKTPCDSSAGGGTKRRYRPDQRSGTGAKGTYLSVPGSLSTTCLPHIDQRG